VDRSAGGTSEIRTTFGRRALAHDDHAASLEIEEERQVFHGINMRSDSQGEI
jgi:hypothetical protein